MCPLKGSEGLGKRSVIQTPGGQSPREPGTPVPCRPRLTSRLSPQRYERRSNLSGSDPKHLWVPVSTASALSPSVGQAMWLRKWIPVRSPSSTTARCRSTPVSRSGSTRTRSTDTAASRDHPAICRRPNRCVLSLDVSMLPSRSRALVRHQLRTFAEVVRRAAVRRASASSRWSCCVAPGRCASRPASDRAQRRSLSVPASRFDAEPPHLLCSAHC